MIRSRIIPCLLIHKGGLVKTRRFKDPVYIGDPLNASRIFSEKKADELLVLDIDASVNGSEPDFALIEQIASQCRMPICYGGGVKRLDQANKIISLGVEKVAISSGAVADPSLLTQIASSIGSQSVVAVIDVRYRYEIAKTDLEVTTHNNTKKLGIDPLKLARCFQDAGAGEIVVNFVDRDGTGQGYDLLAARLFRDALHIPLTFMGGARDLHDIRQLGESLGVVGAAVGSLFVFKGKRNAVLLNYPDQGQKKYIHEGSRFK